MNVQKPRMSELLRSVAVTASVTTKSLGLRRVDKEASKQSDRAHNARDGIGKTTVSRLGGSEDRVDEIRSKGVEAQDALKSITTAWGEMRLLANVNLDEWLKTWARIKKEYDQLVQAFIDDAPQMIAEAERNKGTYKVEPPTVEEIKNGFALSWKPVAIANTQDFSANGLSAQMEEALKRRLEAEVEAAYQLAQKDALERVAEPLGKMVERLQKYSEREEEKARGLAVDKGGTFRDSLTRNVEDIAKVFRSFNLTGDPVLDKIANQLDGLIGIEADDLRKNRQFRNDTAARAKAILEELGVYKG